MSEVGYAISLVFQIFPNFFLLFSLSPYNTSGVSVIQEEIFVIMKMMDESKTFKKANPIRLYKEINNLVPGSEIKKLRNGMLLIKVMSKTHFEKLLKLSTFYGEHVLVEPHRGLNSCKGVISSFELLYCEEQEIKEELSSQG